LQFMGNPAPLTYLHCCHSISLVWCLFIVAQCVGASVLRSSSKRKADVDTPSLGKHELGSRSNGSWDFHMLKERSGEHFNKLLSRKTEWSALHEVVGIDGVFMIQQIGAAGEQTTGAALNEVGIYPMLIPALDVENARVDELRDGCHSSFDAETTKFCKEPKPGNNTVPVKGCEYPIEQAFAESHRRALLVANSRNATWTAIIQSNAVPVDPTTFNKNFQQVWEQVPEDVYFVRLGWCSFGNIEQHTSFNYGSFRLIDDMAIRGSSYYTGGCNTAYMIHRDVIPTFLGLFPCCSALDACLEDQLFRWPPGCGQISASKCWGQRHMMGIDISGSESLTAGWAPFAQHGILVQDERKMEPTESEWTAAVPYQ